MLEYSATRSDIAAALQLSLFKKFASNLTAATLRNAIARRLAEEKVEVVVIAATNIGSSVPYSGAEVVWQPKFGGEFERQLVSWASTGDLIICREDTGHLRIFADCPKCFGRNELIVDNEDVVREMACSHCSALLA